MLAGADGGVEPGLDLGETGVEDGPDALVRKDVAVVDGRHAGDVEEGVPDELDDLVDAGGDLLPRKALEVSLLLRGEVLDKPPLDAQQPVVDVLGHLLLLQVREPAAAAAAAERDRDRVRRRERVVGAKRVQQVQRRPHRVREVHHRRHVVGVLRNGAAARPAAGEVLGRRRQRVRVLKLLEVVDRLRRPARAEDSGGPRPRRQLVRHVDVLLPLHTHVPFVVIVIVITEV